MQLTGDRRADIAAVARSQIGYHEGGSESDLSGSSSSSGNYTEYGRCFGTTSDAWCAMFVWWCGAQADVPEHAIPHNEWAKVMTSGCPYTAFEQSSPQIGDLVFTTANGIYEGHVGIIVDVTADSIYTVEGNIENNVVSTSYNRATGEHIGGKRSIMYIGSPDYYCDRYATRERQYIRFTANCTAQRSPAGSYSAKKYSSGASAELLAAVNYGGSVWYQFEDGLDAYWVKSTNAEIYSVVWSDWLRMEEQPEQVSTAVEATQVTSSAIPHDTLQTVSTAAESTSSAAADSISTAAVPESTILSETQATSPLTIAAVSPADNAQYISPADVGTYTASSSDSTEVLDNNGTPLLLIIAGGLALIMLIGLVIYLRGRK